MQIALLQFEMPMHILCCVVFFFLCRLYFFIQVSFNPRRHSLCAHNVHEHFEFEAFSTLTMNEFAMAIPEIAEMSLISRFCI